jgi:hypothetical protein
MAKAESGICRGAFYQVIRRGNQRQGDFEAMESESIRSLEEYRAIPKPMRRNLR